MPTACSCRSQGLFGWLNGTRHCLGLPLFTAGVHVTAERVVIALHALCPPELQFVISDNGAQFIAETFAQFAGETAFVHVRTAPYRARTNGIAERFARTLKEWLETHSWNSPEEIVPQFPPIVKRPRLR